MDGRAAEWWSDLISTFARYRNRRATTCTTIQRRREQPTNATGILVRPQQYDQVAVAGHEVFAWNAHRSRWRQPRSVTATQKSRLKAGGPLAWF